MEYVIGIDIGNVISKNDTDSGKRLNIEVEGAVNSVTELVKGFGAENVWLISKCGPNVQKRTNIWLEEINFFERTGMDPYNVCYCINRLDKARICAELKVTHMIDDRLEILGNIDTKPGLRQNQKGYIVPHKIAFNPGGHDLRDYGHFKDDMSLIAKNWKDVMAYVVRSVGI